MTDEIEAGEFVFTYPVMFLQYIARSQKHHDFHDFLLGLMVFLFLSLFRGFCYDFHDLSIIFCHEKKNH